MIDLGILEPGLTAPLAATDLATDLAPFAAAIQTCAEDTLAQASLDAQQITTVVFVGGSSLMHVVRDTMRHLFPQARFEQSEAFTAVAAGLAMAATQADSRR